MRESNDRNIRRDGFVSHELYFGFAVEGMARFIGRTGVGQSFDRLTLQYAVIMMAS
jgi:hypothetical protein